jgi:hypothetical protein
VRRITHTKQFKSNGDKRLNQSRIAGAEHWDLHIPDLLAAPPAIRPPTMRGKSVAGNVYRISLPGR